MKIVLGSPNKKHFQFQGSTLPNMLILLDKKNFIPHDQNLMITWDITLINSTQDSSQMSRERPTTFLLTNKIEVTIIDTNETSVHNVENLLEKSQI